MNHSFFTLEYSHEHGIRLDAYTNQDLPDKDALNLMRALAPDGQAPVWDDQLTELDERVQGMQARCANNSTIRGVYHITTGDSTFTRGDMEALLSYATSDRQIQQITGERIRTWLHANTMPWSDQGPRLIPTGERI